MVCEHLEELDRELTAAGIEVIYRDRPSWGDSHYWNRYACYLDLESIRKRIRFAECVKDWVFKDHWQGEERGFECTEHHDAVIGDYDKRPDRPVIS